MSKEYTPEEAREILVKLAKSKIESFEANLVELRKREVAKAIIPPHRHNEGMSVGSGVEDVPAAKMGKAELKKCGTCGKLLAKCMCKSELDKAMLTDAKGKHKDNGINPDAKLADTKAKHVNKPTKADPGSGGIVTKGKLGKSEQNHIVEQGIYAIDSEGGMHTLKLNKAEKGPAKTVTNTPVHKMGAPKKAVDEMHGKLPQKEQKVITQKAEPEQTREKIWGDKYKQEKQKESDDKTQKMHENISNTKRNVGAPWLKGSVKKADVPMAKPPGGGSPGKVPMSKPAVVKDEMDMQGEPMAMSSLDPKAQAKQHMMHDASKQVHTNPAPVKPMPTPAQHAERANMYAEHAPKPGIFGKLGKAGFGVSTMPPKVNMSPPVLTGAPKLKPAGIAHPGRMGVNAPTVGGQKTMAARPAAMSTSVKTNATPSAPTSGSGTIPGKIK